MEELERELLEVNANSDRLFRTEAELVELQMVLERAGSFFEEAQQVNSPTAQEAASFEAPLLESAIPVSDLTFGIDSSLNFVASIDNKSFLLVLF